MAKKRINNYKFKPGIGYSENTYPNAYSLLNQNRAFLVSEATAFINQEVTAATQIQTDIGYIIDGVAFDVALGTNFNAVWFGRAESLSGNISKTEERRLTRVKTAVAALTDVAADATSLSRSNAAFAEITDIMSNGVGSADTVTVTNPTDATASRIAAKDRILNNLTFLRNEIIAWTNVNYPAYDTTQTHGISSGCIDVQYVIEAAAYDVLYGGNSASYNHAKYFPNYVTSGLTISGTHQTHVVAAYGRLKTIISQVILGTSVTVSSGNATSQNLSLIHI